MTPLLLLHSALGLRPSLLAAADRLRAGGREVVVPDLFGGRTFDAPEPGVAFAQQEVGWPVLLERAAAAAPAGPLVVAGLSLGAGLAMQLGVTRPGVRGVLLLHAALSLDGDWPEVPVEAHYAVDDPWNDEGQPEEMLRSVARGGAPASAHAYPGSGHLFTDADSPDSDPASASLLWERVAAFLARSDA